MAMRRMREEEKRPPCPTHGSLADRFKEIVDRDRELFEEATNDPHMVLVRKNTQIIHSKSSSQRLLNAVENGYKVAGYEAESDII